MARGAWGYAPSALALLGCVLGCIAGCDTVEPATEVVVVVDTDLRRPPGAGAEFDTLEVTVARDAGDPGDTRSFDAGELAWPVVLPVVPRGGRDAFFVKAVLLRSGAPVLTRAQTIQFAPKRRVRFDLALHRACAGESCDGAFTCGAPEGVPVCGPAVIDGRDLPAWRGNVPADGGLDAPADAPPVPALVAWWRLDAAPNGVFPDASGNGHDGTCPGSCPGIVASGRVGNAAGFQTDPSRFIEIAHAPVFEGERGFTVAAWVRPAVAKLQAFVSKPLAGNDSGSWLLYLQSNGTLHFEGSAVGLTGPVIPLGEWTHLAGSWDGGTMRLFVNGAVVAERAGAIEFDENPILIGLDKDDGVPKIPAEGAIDEVRFYAGALREDEIDALASP